MIQLSDSPIEATVAALWAGTTSGIMINGTGPKPTEKAATNAIVKMLASTACELTVSERSSAEKLIPAMEESSNGLRPTR